jgi:hypothetical protein
MLEAVPGVHEHSIKFIFDQYLQAGDTYLRTAKARCDHPSQEWGLI